MAIKFDNTLNSGHLMIASAALISWGGTYVSMTNSIARLNEIILELKADQSQTAQRTSSLELSYGRLDEKMIAVVSTTLRIETLLKDREP
jgi:hypothetical protein